MFSRTDGVGLSAPQVGVNVQLMVFNPEGEKGKGEEIVLVNPRIFKYSNKRTLFTEGCLSFPEIEADVEVKSNISFFDHFKYTLNYMPIDRLQYIGMIFDHLKFANF